MDLENIEKDLKQLALKRQDLTLLIDNYLQVGMTKEWVSFYKQHPSNYAVKSLVLRTIFGDPFITKGRQEAEREHIELYCRFIVLSVDEDFDRLLNLVDDVPKYLRDILGESIRKPYRFVRAAVNKFHGGCFDEYREKFILSFGDIKSYFAETGESGKITTAFDNLGEFTTTVNLCKYFIAFMTSDYHGKMQDKLPRSIPALLNIPSGAPSVYHLLDTISLLRDGVLTIDESDSISEFYKSILKFEFDERSTFFNVCADIGWLTENTITKMRSGLRSGHGQPRTFTSHLFNKQRALDDYQRYDAVFLTVNTDQLLDAIKKHYDDLDVGKLIGIFVDHPGDGGIGLRDIANIMVLNELERDDINIPYVAKWRLGEGNQETGSIERKYPQGKKRGPKNFNFIRETIDLERLLKCKSATLWKIGMSVKENERLLVPRCFLQSFRWPNGCELLPYGPEKVSPDENPYSDWFRALM